MGSIVIELQKDALDRNVKISDLLRKALVVARRLSLHEFQTWIENELEGYRGKTKNEIPDYRNLSGQVCGFNLYRGWVPIIFNDKDQEAIFSKRKSRQSVAELENLVEHKETGERLTMPFPPEAHLHLCQAIGFQTQVNLFVDESEIVRIIETVRNVILNWALKLEEEGILGENLSFSKKEKEAANKSPQNITNFYGTVVSPQIQQGEMHGVQISVNLSIQHEQIAEFIKKFKEALPALGLTEDQKGEAKAELQTVEAQLKSPKPKSSIIHEGLKSLRTILEGAGGAVAAQLLGELIKIIM
jgi:hypothetical protein